MVGLLAIFSDTRLYFPFYGFDSSSCNLISEEQPHLSW